MKVTVARRLVQVCSLLLFCLPPLLAGWGVFGLFAGGDDQMPAPAEGVFFGSLSSTSVGGVTLMDPLAAAEVFVASHSLELAALAGALIILVGYGLVRGRAFCGWVCPVNLLGEGADALRRKMGVQVPERTVPRRAKMALAVVVVALSAVLAVPVFEAVSPISAVNKGLVFGGIAGIGTLAAVLAAEIFFSKRLWCRSLCPLGGVYQAIGRAGQVNVAMNYEACIHCDRCREACLADPVILDDVLAGNDAIVRAGDCMACGACVDACPADALTFRLGRPRRT